MHLTAAENGGVDSLLTKTRPSDRRKRKNLKIDKARIHERKESVHKD